MIQAPFCVHPKTGRICVPIDTEHIWDFNPETVPTVQQVANELQASLREGVPSDHAVCSMTEGLAQEVNNLETSLDPYLWYFQKFVDQMLESDKNT